MIEWLDADEVQVDGRTFRVIDAQSAKDAPGATAIRKPRWFVERYIELARSLQPSRVIELGIDKGGSTVFFALLMNQLERLLAIDIGEVPAALADFVGDDPRGSRLRCEGGIDQSDRSAVKALVHDTFGDEALDFVIDDASHLLPETRASFDTLFPRLRPGGVFVIEDWSWDHQVGRVIAERMQAGDLPPPTDPDAGYDRAMPLSRLTLECVLVAGYAPEVISDVRIRRGWAEIERGPADLEGDGFAVADQVGWLGTEVLAHRFAEV
ncbi:MAG: class I SAM-dependent methyltransferase [Acidimicrobiales bacterium]